MIKLNNFYKKNQNIANYFISKEIIPFETDKASFINLPNHNRHIGFWLSNKFIYPSQKHSEQVAIMHKALFLNEPKKVKTNNNNNLIWNDKKVEQLIRDLEELIIKWKLN